MKHVVRKKVYACVHKFPQNIYIYAHWVPVRTVQTLGAEASVLVDIVLSELADAFGTVVSVSDIN